MPFDSANWPQGRPEWPEEPWKKVHFSILALAIILSIVAFWVMIEFVRAYAKKLYGKLAKILRAFA
ncbi:hypothetical protein IIC45_01100 [Patescibacteria group bacterium]|nr:hypothetical protein [Patescibacteria group bacterium]